MMKQRRFGKLGTVSSLSLGGGGLGQLWGSTTREEAIATTQMAVASGINLLDMAPVYGDGEAENVIGKAFDGKLPDDVRVTTKCNLVDVPVDRIHEVLEKSLIESLARMKVSAVDIFFLHNWIIDETTESAIRGTNRIVFEEYVVPAFKKITSKGLAKTWGITGIGDPKVLIDILGSDNKPDCIQIITNLLDSPGGLGFPNVDPQPREIIKTAVESEVPIMGIRAVQAGALTNQIDRYLPPEHPESLDFKRAKAFRSLARNLAISPSILAHQYALSMVGPSTITLGVKNRDELAECLLAEQNGILDESVTGQINAAVSGVGINDF